MIYHTIKIEDSDYQHLEKSAQIAGLTIEEFLKKLITEHQTLKREISHKQLKKYSRTQSKNRWVLLSEKIRRNPPLKGAGDYVRKSINEFKNDFEFNHDKEISK